MSEASVSVRVVARFRPPLLNARAEKLAAAAQEASKVKDLKDKEKEKEKDKEKGPATPDAKGSSKTKKAAPPSPGPYDGFSLTYEDDKSVVLRIPGAQLEATNTGQNKERDNAYPFTFDAVFGPDSTQDQIFAALAKETVDDILKGYNGTIFAYGQTGSGKSHTMFGPKGDPTQAGIIPRAAGYLFKGINDSDEIEEVTIKCSFLEIYRENIRDLLNPKNNQLRVRETPAGEVLVQGLIEEYCSNEHDILKLIETGEKSRSVASTEMNAVSSRSHSVFIVTTTQKLKDGSTRIGKLNLADLAGSERIGQTGATGQTLEEAKKINQSLSALGNCINALTDSTRTHVPFRDSTLTYLLKDSLGGNTKTTLLVNCSAEPINGLETLSTLRFAQRAKKVQNKARINKKKSVAELTAEVNQLRKELAACRKQLKAVQQVLQKLKDSGVKIDFNLAELNATSTAAAAAAAAADEKAPDTPSAAASPTAAAGPTAADLERLERERKERELKDAELKARELKLTELETTAAIRERERELAEQKRIDDWKRRDDERAKRDDATAKEHERIASQSLVLKTEAAKLEADRKAFESERKRRDIERAAEESRLNRKRKEEEAKRASDEAKRKDEEKRRDEERKKEEARRAEEDKKRSEEYERRRKEEEDKFQHDLAAAQSAILK